MASLCILDVIMAMFFIASQSCSWYRPKKLTELEQRWQADAAWQATKRALEYESQQQHRQADEAEALPTKSLHTYNHTKSVIFS